MKDYLINMALSIIFAVLKDVIKNKQSKKEMKSACLKLFENIKVAYNNDPDFEC